jgi:hypothetical protein
MIRVSVTGIKHKNQIPPGSFKCPPVALFKYLPD